MYITRTPPTPREPPRGYYRWYQNIHEADWPRAACFHRGRIKGRIMFHKRSRNFLVSVFTRIALLHYINGNIIVIIGIMLSCAAHTMAEPIGGCGGGGGGGMTGKYHTIPKRPCTATGLARILNPLTTRRPRETLFFRPCFTLFLRFFSRVRTTRG